MLLIPDMQFKNVGLVNNCAGVGWGDWASRVARRVGYLVANLSWPKYKGGLTNFIHEPLRDLFCFFRCVVLVSVLRCDVGRLSRFAV